MNSPMDLIEELEQEFGPIPVGEQALVVGYSNAVAVIIHKIIRIVMREGGILLINQESLVSLIEEINNHSIEECKRIIRETRKMSEQLEGKQTEAILDEVEKGALDLKNPTASQVKNMKNKFKQMLEEAKKTEQESSKSTGEPT
jgi:hypothetical protein